jgi:hypothetical protein
MLGEALAVLPAGAAQNGKQRCFSFFLVGVFVYARPGPEKQ